MIPGIHVTTMMSTAQTQAQFKQVIERATSVIVYRSSPAQKAQIVRFVRSKVKGSVTLAIGDGANDVNMIQSAHIGIGIYGKEGNQATSFSDFALPKFRDLRRLLFWHGRKYSMNFLNFTVWYIFKSALYSSHILYFNTSNGYSAITIYDDLFYGTYDVSMTTFAIGFFLCVEQDISFTHTNQEH
mmetsp:Transcript_3804/g.3716  ORF Transcript_3804/g.3716 Transcript_3804/m.3716 type:complete len:185 (-) Transcript_3804:532-1086(-)